MPLQARITDGTTTIDLNGSPNWVQEYPMATPETREDVITNLGDGDTLSTPTWSNVTESITLLLTGANAAAVRTTVQSIERLLDRARQNRLTWRGVKVWLEVRFDHDSGWWRSQILAGRLSHSHGPDQIWRGYLETSLIITRRYYWEGEEVQLALASQATPTPTTNYATVYNNDDETSNTNWFQAAASQVVATVIPAPIRLEVRNQNGAYRGLRSLHVGNYVHMDPSNVDPIMRGEQASFTETSWSLSSEVLAYRWALTAAQLEDFAGQYCRVLVAFSTMPAGNALARARLQLAVNTVHVDVVVGEQIKVNGDAVIDLGAMPLPPGGAAMWSNSGMSLALSLQVAGGSSVGVNWIQVMPAGHGLYRHIRGLNNAEGLENNQSIMDDGIEGLLYKVEGSSRWSTHRGLHTPLHVFPGTQHNRFRLMKQNQGNVGAGEVYGVKAWYRPRRLTL